MKKTIALLLIAVFLFVIPGCEEKETEDKAETTYMDWFGVKIDLSKIEKKCWYNDSEYFICDIFMTTFEERINNYKKNGYSYCVVRAKCTGDMKQIVKEDLTHFHYNPTQFNECDGYYQFYVETPYEVIDILENSGTTLKSGDVINVETDHLMLWSLKVNSDITEWSNDPSKNFVLYVPLDMRFVFPRIGEEYVFILIYRNETNCYEANMTYACELSSPEENLLFNQKMSGNGTYTMLKRYYDEILDRYNIEIE